MRAVQGESDNEDCHQQQHNPPAIRFAMRHGPSQVGRGSRAAVRTKYAIKAELLPRSFVCSKKRILRCLFVFFAFLLLTLDAYGLSSLPVYCSQDTNTHLVESGQHTLDQSRMNVAQTPCISRHAIFGRMGILPEHYSHLPPTRKRNQINKQAGKIKQNQTKQINKHTARIRE